MKEFWNSLLTEKSWEILQELKKEYEFILIGGWAIYLLTKQKKSKDVDIVVSIKELEKLKKENLSKNDNLKKYEIKRGEIDIDIYTEYYSKLAIPVEDIKEYTIKTEGFSVPKPEIMLILKQAAYKDRENSIKGEKDLIDIASIIFLLNLDFNFYLKILKKYKMETFLDELARLIKNFKDYNSLNLTPRELKIKKNKVINILKKV